ncbi:MAG: hypothetical protein KDA44_20515 [Planctomycetales bacterium]|nr:hypothetical protein [Planctomycetales bacterium]
MTSILENPLPIWIAGAVCATFAGVVFAARRNLASLVALAVIVLLTLAGAAIERAVVTPREEIEAATTGVLDALEANDLPAVLALIDPAAKTVRADAEAAMPQVKIDKANIEGTLTIELAPAAAEPTAAVAKFRGILIGNTRRGGATIGYRDQVEINWVRRGDQWLIDGYTVYENGKPIEAAGRLRRGVK